MDLITRRRALLAEFNTQPIIPRNGLIFGFQPNISWNQTKPSTFLDATGTTQISTDLEWGESLYVSPDYLVTSEQNTSTVFNFTLQRETLTSGFTETIWFVAPISKTNFYFNQIKTNQLAWIYGYTNHTLEFYTFPPTIFRTFARKNINDTNRHFAAISYDATTGDTIFVFDDEVTQTTLEKIDFLISKDLSYVGGNKPFSVGQLLLYRRPMQASEIATIRSCNGKWE